MVKTLVTIINAISLKIMDAIIAITPVIIEDKETYFEIYNVKRKDKTIIINNNGLTPKKIPPDVATAFPPLNFANIG